MISDSVKFDDVKGINRDYITLKIVVVLSNSTKRETSLKITPKTIIAEILHDLINKKIINRLEADDCMITFGKQSLNKFNYIEDYREIDHMS
jgi:hypothetical protein